MFLFNFWPFLKVPKTVHLIDDCLICILVCLPLSDLLLRVQIVCHRWKSLVRHATARKRCLRLLPVLGTNVIHDQFDGFGFKLCPNSLVVGDLTNRVLEYIVNKFPNVTSLEFRQANPKTLHMLSYLLDKWPNLVTLKIIVGTGWSKPNLTNAEWNCCLDCISTKLSFSLRHLVICPLARHLYVRIRLPVNFCAQLESFHCGLLFEEANISMAQIAKLKCLHTFGFIPYDTYNNALDIEARDQYNRVLLTQFSSSRLNELWLRNEFDGYPRDWALQCAFYRNYQTLTNLCVCLSRPLHWFMLDSGLHRLTNLVYLKVQNHFVDFRYIDTFPRNPWCTKPDPNPRYRSLRTLHLAHVPCFEFNWAVSALPNLETLQMDRQIRYVTPSTHSSGDNTFASLHLFKGGKLRKIIYAGRVYHTQPELNIVY